jgi:hypothetical protein
MFDREIRSLQTVLVITLGFTFVYWLTQHLLWLYLSMVTGALALLSSRIAQIIHSSWMKFAHLLGLLVPNILLTLVFFLFLWPIALLSRLFRSQDPLLIRSQNAVSLFRERNKTFEAIDFENPF